MKYWESGAVVTIVILGLLLLGAEGLRALVPSLKRLAIPASILGGLAGLILGPDLVGVLPVDRGVLEIIVYHGLALVFIAVSLQSPAQTQGRVAAGVRSFTFGIPFMQGMQALIGLSAVLLLGLGLGEVLHPGLGLLLPLGFEEGPGQALSLGAAWEASGMRDGAQVGLIIAALGYGWSVFLGVPLAVYGRKKGWLARPPADDDAQAEVASSPLGAPGALDRFTLQVVLVLGCYGITWLVCKGLSVALSGMPEIASVIWGFHFMIGAGVAMGVRPLLARLPGGSPVDDALVGRVSGFTVDVMTCASLVAIQLAVFQANWLPIAIVTTLGGVLTLVACLYFSSRAFPDAPFEHALLWFGMSTGTLPMGLALLRIIDPELKSPAPVTAVLGSATAVIFIVPIMLGIIPMTVAAWPESYPFGGWIALGATAGYTLVLLVLWRLFAPLRFHGPAHRLWWRPGA